MAILVGPETRVIVQGLTGRAATFHVGRMLDYGKVTILGTGTSTESFGRIDAPIAAPLELRNHITGV